MRGIFTSAYTLLFSLLLSACAVLSETGTEEAILFSANDAGTEKPQAVLKPHNDLPLAIQFSCPKKIDTAMTSFFYPLPPIMPVAFINKHESYLRIKLPEDAEPSLARVRVVDQQGQIVPIPEAPDTQLSADKGKALELTYVLPTDCDVFDGGAIEVASFSYKNKSYPATEARLHFKSKRKVGVSYAPF